MNRIAARKGRTADTPQARYRGDIDGLRAVAVLGVLLFHAEVAAIPGGYVGVDIFFIISGFLITRNLMDEAAEGPVSFRRFYLRRTLRLMPALIATLALTTAGALVILSPPDLADYGRSLAWTALSLSNFHFATVAGYFAAASEIKPLLHTWSLAVEEQFYLLWPGVLVAILRWGGRRTALWFVALAIPAGLALSALWIAVNPQQAYFLTPFRGFQFMMGAACVWLVPHRPGPMAERILFLIGAGLIAWSMLVFRPETPFPGLNAAIPALGAALLIWAGRAPGLTRVLANRPMIAIGLISYSAYLAHWPVVVFYRYLGDDHFGPVEQAVMVLAALGLGWVLHTLVEKPFRLRGATARRPSFGPMRNAIACLLVVAAAGFALDRAGGLPGRMQANPEAAAYREAAAFQFMEDYGDGVLRLGAGGTGRVLIIGDSMMQNYVPALMSLPRISAGVVDVVTRGGCFMGAGVVLVNSGSVDTGCRDLRDTALAMPDGYDLVIWTQNWHGYGATLAFETAEGHRPAARAAVADGAAASRWTETLAGSAAAWAGKGERLVVIGPQIRVENLSPLAGRIGPLTDTRRIRAALPVLRERDAAGRDRLAAALGKDLRAAAPNVVMIDPRALLCPDGACALHDGAAPYYFDATHHTAVTTPLLARRLGDALAQTGK